MPASGISKLALHLSRFANFQAAHQGANAFRGSAASGGASGSASSAASISSAASGAGTGSGAGGAKFHAGRGAHFSYTNTSGRAVVQAGSSSTSDGPNGLEDDEDGLPQLQLHQLQHIPHQPIRRAPGSTKGRASNALVRSSGGVGAGATSERDSTRESLLAHSLTDGAMQARFRNAFAALSPIIVAPEGAEESDTFDLVASTPDVSAVVSRPTAKLYRDLVDAKAREDRVAIVSLVDAYCRLPPSEKTTAGFNAALQAQLSVRRPGESLREVRETHQNMLEAGCVPNSGTLAVLVKALCIRDHEKQIDKKAPAVSPEEEASSEAWRVLQTSSAGLQDIAAYNALLARCAVKGDVKRATSVFVKVVECQDVEPNAATYAALIDCHAAAAQPGALAAIKVVLHDVRKLMRAVHWVNDSDEVVFEAYMRAMNKFRLPNEALALFEDMLVDDDLPNPSVDVTGSLVQGFVDSGDLDTAKAWIEKIENLNASCAAGGSILAAPDFTSLKQRLNMSRAELALSESPDVSSASLDSDVPTLERLAPSAPTSASYTPEVVDTILSTATQSFPPSICPVPPSGYPPLQCVDCDLGERIKFMLRIRRQDAHSQPNIEAAFRLAEKEIHEAGNYAPPETFAQLLNLFGRARKLTRVHRLRDYAHVAVAGLKGDSTWQSAAWVEVEDNVISALAHGGDLKGAYAVRHSMLALGVAPSANAYAALVSSIRDSTDEALLAEQLWEESQQMGVRPNIYLVNTVISRLGRARRAERALQLYNSLPVFGLKPTSITYGASLNCAVRVGDIQTAESIFASMESDPAFVARPPGYNSMIQFFTYIKPDRVKALEYWEKMQARGVGPSSHTYKLLLDVHGAIEPVDVNAMNAIFLRLLRDHSVQVAGPHWAALISCHGADLIKCQDIFRSIPLKTGATPDAVAYEALLLVYANHGRVDLIDNLFAEMIRFRVARTAYIANHAIQGYARDRTFQGLTKARTVFLAMSQPPAGVASSGNHPLPRHHGSGTGFYDAVNGSGPTRPWIPIEEVLADVGSTSALAGAAANASDATAWAVAMDLDSSLAMLHTAFAQVHPEPSTYERMITVELEAGCHWNAQCVVERMSERAFPTALVFKARNLLAKGVQIQPRSSMSVAQSSE